MEKTAFFPRFFYPLSSFLLLSQALLCGFFKLHNRSNVKGDYHLAMVTRLVTDEDCDPYQQLLGVVTLEDIVEEILQVVFEKFLICLFYIYWVISINKQISPSKFRTFKL